MRLIGYNYTQQTPTEITASSSNVNYPVSNIKHEHRAKEWRSNVYGNFEITLANNKINFKESAMGAELTATVAVGNYTNLTLQAAIKESMELVGSSTYTVSYSQTTGLWTISSDGSYLSLLNSSGTNQANSLLKQCLGFANTDRTGSLSYTGANIAIHTSEYILMDLVTTESINSVVLLWAKEDGIKLSNNAVIKIQANATNEWSSPAVNQTMTINNTYELSSHYFTASQTYRYWRLLIQDPTNVNLYVNVGVIVLGEAEVVDNPDNGFIYTLTDTSKATTTDFGHEYVDKYPLLAQLDLNFAVLDYDSALAFINLYKQVGTRKAVFIALDSSADVFDKDLFSIYGKFRTPLSLNHINYNIFNYKLIIGEVG